MELRNWPMNHYALISIQTVWQKMCYLSICSKSHIGQPNEIFSVCPFVSCGRQNEIMNDVFVTILDVKHTETYRFLKPTILKGSWFAWPLHWCVQNQRTTKTEIATAGIQCSSLETSLWSTSECLSISERPKVGAKHFSKLGKKYRCKKRLCNTYKSRENERAAYEDFGKCS